MTHGQEELQIEYELRSWFFGICECLSQHDEDHEHNSGQDDEGE